MTITRRTTSTRICLVVLVLALVALTGRHAEAQSYYVPPEQLTTIPASWAAYTTWAQYVAGGTVTSAGGGTVAAVGTIAAPAGGALAGGLVGYNCFQDLKANTQGEISDVDAALCVPRMARDFVESLWTRWTDPDADPADPSAWAVTDPSQYVTMDQITDLWDGTASGERGLRATFTPSVGPWSWHMTFWTSKAATHPATTDCYVATESTSSDVDSGQQTSVQDWPPAGGSECWPFKIQLKGEWSDDVLIMERNPHASGGGTPERVITVEANCVDPVTGMTQTVTESVSYTSADLDAQGRIEREIPQVDCPEGWRVGGVDITRTAPDLPDRQIGTATTPTEMTDPNDEYADCWTAAAACVLMLYRVHGSTLYDCNTYVDLCSGWTTDPDRDTVYECRFGQYQPGADGSTMAHVVPLSDCFFLERAFDDGTLTQTHDGDPDGDGDPEAGGTTDPAPDSNLFRNALRWAFVPSEGTTDAMTELRADLETRTPVQQLTAIGTYFGEVGGQLSDSEVCWQVTADLTTAILDGGDQAVVDTCGGNVVYTTLVSWRPVLAFLMYGVLFVPLGWWAWRQYAPGSQGVS